MSETAPTPAPSVAAPTHAEGTARRAWLTAALLLGPCALLIVLRDTLPAWTVTPPESWRVPFIEWINVVVELLRKTPLVGDFTFRDGTRAVAGWIEWPLDLLEGVLISGFAGGAVPSLPWTMIAGLAAVWGWYLRGWRLSLLAGGCVLYLALFGKWKLSMITLSAVLVAAPVAGAIGLGLGILAVKWRGFERILWPLLNVMQSLPHFSYLIPVAVFIGVSHKAGTIATILFAMPPMARLTILGLRGVSPEIVEAGLMAGCTRFQMLHKVEIPAARPTIMVGVNQVIMQCLAMVVIASFIGAKGLGHDLLFRLQSLRIGQALEIGVAIVFMAVTLDRLSQALAAKEPVHLREGAWWRAHPFIGAAAAVVALTTAASFMTPHASVFPKELTLTTAPFWDGIVDWVTVNLFDPLNLFRDALLLHVLIPMRTGYQAVPWLAVAVLVGGIGWRLGRARIALPVLGFFAFVMLSGFWGRSQITAYMVSFAVLVCVAVGLPLGIWASRREWRAKLVQLLCDTFQTFPSFIYLIPVIMLFKVGDVAAISAIVIYASIPAVRYTMIGLRSVPGHIIEAAITSGCTPRQILWKVRMPLAFPEIMLGVNQTIMFALFMVIIAAFIGTRDLGQEIFRALTFNDAGKGLVVGLCVAFIGLTADRLITEWAAMRKRELGIG